MYRKKSQGNTEKKTDSKKIVIESMYFMLRKNKSRRKLELEYHFNISKI